MSQTHFIDNEKINKEVILFIHGNSHSSKTFQKQIQDKELNNYRLIAYDLFGHGKSKRRSDYNIDVFTQQLLEFIAAHNLKNINIVGHSLGGHIAIQTLNKIKNVKSLLIFGTPPLENPLTSTPFLNSSALEKLQNVKLNHQDVSELIFLFTNNSFKFEKFERQDIQQTDPKFRTTFLDSIINGHYQDEIKIIKKSKAPLKILVGENDQVVCKDYLEKHFGGNFDIIKNANHNIHRTNPLEFNQALLEFIKSG